MEHRDPSSQVTVFVCTNERVPGHRLPCCGHRGGAGLRDTLKAMVRERELQQQIKIRRSGCLGTCREGPALQVFPEGRLYVGVTGEDLSRLLEELISFLPSS